MLIQQKWTDRTNTTSYLKAPEMFCTETRKRNGPKAKKPGRVAHCVSHMRPFACSNTFKSWRTQMSLWTSRMCMRQWQTQQTYSVTVEYTQASRYGCEAKVCYDRWKLTKIQHKAGITKHLINKLPRRPYAINALYVLLWRQLAKTHSMYTCTFTSCISRVLKSPPQSSHVVGLPRVSFASWDPTLGTAWWSPRTPHRWFWWQWKVREFPADACGPCYW